ncbi:MAG TPA: hypothetical protein PLU79_20825, partial [Burkholderiaceae bacterium]|nr:hypothetical protein [Burkholderiaceae bacterium]
MKISSMQRWRLATIAGAAVLATSTFAAESLQDVMKERGLSQQDLLAAAKTYVPTGKRDEFVTFSSG